jgi:polar amino acid transport system substrate-binding protein
MRSKRIHYGIVVLGLFCFFLSGRAMAGKEITILSSNYPPHIYVENGEIKGIRVELMTELFKRMGYTYVPKIMPWARAVVIIKEGKADGICSIWYKPEREDFLYYPKFPYVLEVQAIYQPAGSKEIFYKNLNDFKALKVGTIRGFSFPKEFMESPLFEIQTVATDKQNFRKLERGRLDVVISDSIVGDYVIKQEGLQDRVYRNKYNYNEGFWGYLAFSKRLPDGKYITEEYDRVMKDLLREGFYSRIFLKYLNRLPDKLPEERK